jgi:hypothetical protein
MWAGVHTHHLYETVGGILQNPRENERTVSDKASEAAGNLYCVIPHEMRIILTEAPTMEYEEAHMHFNRARPGRV